MKRTDHTDKKYNRLTGIKYLRVKNRQTLWLWKCDCGTFAEADGSKVKNGHTKSCGCYREEINKKLHTSAMYVIRKRKKRNRGNEAWRALSDEDRSEESE